MTQNRGIALVVSGPSGVGKGTLIGMLMNEFKNLEFSISYTTRKPRPNEIDGVHYYFVSKEEFKKMIDENKFAEWAEVHGNFYGTPIDEIEKKLKKGVDVVFDIDVQGARQLKRNLPSGIFIFIMPPSMDELKNRLIKRSQDPISDIEIRLKNAQKEINSSREFDYIVVNDDLNVAYEQLRCIYVSMKLKVRK